MSIRRKIILGALLAAIAVTFTEAWVAQVAAARTGGRPFPELWPTATEALIAIVILVYWEAREEQREAGWLRLLLGLLTGVSAVFLALDALGAVGDLSAPRRVIQGFEWWLRLGTAVWTPIALFLGIELAMWLQYGGRPQENPQVTAQEAAPPTSRELPPAAADLATIERTSWETREITREINLGDIPSHPDASQDPQEAREEEVLARLRTLTPRPGWVRIRQETGWSEHRAKKAARALREETQETSGRRG